jgi:hypothetical protein
MGLTTKIAPATGEGIGSTHDAFIVERSGPSLYNVYISVSANIFLCFAGDELLTRQGTTVAPKTPSTRQ